MYFPVICKKEDSSTCAGYLLWLVNSLEWNVHAIVTPTNGEVVNIGLYLGRSRSKLVSFLPPLVNCASASVWLYRHYFFDSWKNNSSPVLGTHISCLSYYKLSTYVCIIHMWIRVCDQDLSIHVMYSTFEKNITCRSGMFKRVICLRSFWFFVSTVVSYLLVNCCFSHWNCLRVLC